MSSRRPITRTEFLKFNERWDSTDRVVLEENVDRFGGVTFESVESGYNHYVAVHDAEGTLLMDVSKGTIYYKGERSRVGSVQRDLEGDHTEHVYRLSTHRAGGGQAEPEPDYGPLCTACFLHHAPGECDR
jgi:hypothetical protein